MEMTTVTRTSKGDFYSMPSLEPYFSDSEEAIQGEDDDTSRPPSPKEARSSRVDSIWHKKRGCK
eukprot:UN01477